MSVSCRWRVEGREASGQGEKFLEEAMKAMNIRERSRPIRAFVCVAVVAVALVRGWTVADPPRTERLPERPRVDALETGSPGVLELVAGGCFDNSDCNDGQACTTDQCVDFACSFQPIPGCIPCGAGFTCDPPTEVVFVVDTSGSMRDEAAALCEGIAGLQQEFADGGISLIAHILGITDTGDGEAFACLTGDVVSMLGGEVPGEPFRPCDFPNGLSAFESWGPATAIVAARFPWQTGRTKYIFPMGDEGPCNGSRPDGCNDPGDDRDSVDNALVQAFDNGVVVSPITGTGSSSCTTTLADLLAQGTFGQAAHLKDARKELIDAVRSALLQYCVPNPNPPCNDRNGCTSGDTCTNGTCVGEPNFETGVQCCNPATGAIMLIDDGDGCTDDSCDAATGTVTHSPGGEGNACNDGVLCTADDKCGADGVCRGQNLNTLPCDSHDDCLGAGCDFQTGFCTCSDTPTLSLLVQPSALPGNGCHTVGSDIIVNAELGFSTKLVAGGNLLIGYDPAVLKFLGIVPGRLVDGASPFGMELFKQIDEVNGRISYAVAVSLTDPGTNGPALMAQLRFKALTACQTDELCFLNGNPFTTRLSDTRGKPVTFTRRCSGVLVINGTPPALVCPPSVAVNADPTRTTATIRWAAPSATSQCDGALPMVCSGVHTSGVNMSPFTGGGGVFPSGIAQFECHTFDSCGGPGTCAWTVEVRRQNAVEVDLELSPRMSTDPRLQPLTRCIEFQFFSNCVESPAVVRESIAFGLPFNLTAHAANVQIKAPAGQFACVTARDPLHTLRSVSDLVVADGKYHAVFKGDPFFGGNWLINGNLNGDDVIDILDFGTLLDQYLSQLPPDATCELAERNADINGDGLVDALDLSFIAMNFLDADKDSCCPDAVASLRRAPLTSISVEEAAQRGVRNAARADLNGDGVIDLQDMAELMRSGRVPDKGRSLGNAR